MHTARPHPDLIQQIWHQAPEHYLLPSSQMTPELLPTGRPGHRGSQTRFGVWLEAAHSQRTPPWAPGSEEVLGKTQVS